MDADYVSQARDKMNSRLGQKVALEVLFPLVGKLSMTGHGVYEVRVELTLQMIKEITGDMLHLGDTPPSFYYEGIDC